MPEESWSTFSGYDFKVYASNNNIKECSFLPEPRPKSGWLRGEDTGRRGPQHLPVVTSFPLPWGLLTSHRGRGRRQLPLSTREGYGATGLTSSCWFAWDCPGFSPEDPQSLKNQDRWSLQMPPAPSPALACSLSVPSLSLTRSPLWPFPSCVSASTLALPG